MEWQVEDDYFDDYSEMQISAFISHDTVLKTMLLCNYFFKERIEYDPDIFIQPPRLILF